MNSSAVSNGNINISDITFGRTVNDIEELELTVSCLNRLWVFFSNILKTHLESLCHRRVKEIILAKCTNL